MLQNTITQKCPKPQSCYTQRHSFKSCTQNLSQECSLWVCSFHSLQRQYHEVGKTGPTTMKAACRVPNKIISSSACMSAKPGNKGTKLILLLPITTAHVWQTQDGTQEIGQYFQCQWANQDIIVLIHSCIWLKIKYLTKIEQK